MKDVTPNNEQAGVAQTNKQQMNALKEHGGKIFYVVLAALAGYFGWQYYQNNYAKVDSVASDKYTIISARHEQLAQAAADPALDDAAKAKISEEETQLLTEIDALVAEHGKTIYAWQALMIKARHQTDKGDNAAAAETLKQAMAIDLDDEGLAAMTNLRYGRALLANSDVDGAMQAAETTVPKAFEASRQELLGDIYVAKNDTEQAKTAYNTAWEALRERHENRAVLALKMQSLGIEVTPIEPREAVVATPAATDAKANANDNANDKANAAADTEAKAPSAAPAANAAPEEVKNKQASN